MKWLQAIQQKLPKHKYAIDAKMLGDNAECAWTNLGYWDEATSSYPQACQQLAKRLAQAVQLTPHDRVLDLGCGQGASLKYWLEHYQIQDLEAVELQQQCVYKIHKQLPQIKAIHCQSFLNLNALLFTQPFDVVLCIDAAYHSDLNLFLNSVVPILNSKGRLGFHTLMLSDTVLNSKQKMKYKWLLKAADVDLKSLMTTTQINHALQQHGLEQIVIEDLSTSVLAGFSQYIVTRTKTERGGLDQIKIQMTAKLCQRLFEEGIVRYIQLSAVKT
ncbi:MULTISPECIES: SAM-dependent methyltransferase [unclassified Acinetobacter]|uniref:SAM-dependent methyltransferase n=1 Tax=unclassified Acinetobacter TaxID=196816 RepID=UPI0004D84F23|nr:MULTISPECIES: class I SAM-dependent methyltransferase [unclassified Acinetobacter]KEC85810.1 methyltransferase [Acinetobacter sp. ETR1]WEE39386.1 methyltransferase domain-containing protein [Acinetobacter sp. TAC-1]